MTDKIITFQTVMEIIDSLCTDDSSMVNLVNDWKKIPPLMAEWAAHIKNTRTNYNEANRFYEEMMSKKVSEYANRKPSPTAASVANYAKYEVHNDLDIRRARMRRDHYSEYLEYVRYIYKAIEVKAWSVKGMVDLEEDLVISDFTNVMKQAVNLREAASRWNRIEALINGPWGDL